MRITAVRLCQNKTFPMFVDYVHVSSLPLCVFIMAVLLFKLIGCCTIRSVLDILSSILHQMSFMMSCVLHCITQVFGILLPHISYIMSTRLTMIIHYIYLMCPVSFVCFIVLNLLLNVINVITWCNFVYFIYRSFLCYMHHSMLLVLQAPEYVSCLHYLQSQSLCPEISGSCLLIWVFIICDFLLFLHIIS